MKKIAFSMIMGLSFIMGCVNFATAETCQQWCSNISQCTGSANGSASCKGPNGGSEDERCNANLCACTPTNCTE